MSKALSIHARTLEILDMTGLIDRFLAAGHPISSSNFYILGDFLNFAGLINSISHYNYALFLEQLKTIAILEDELEQRGVKIDRGWELMDTKVVGEEDGSSYVETTIRRALDGSNTRATESKKVFGLTDLDAEEIDKQYEIQVVRSQYLIGADGGRSVVRHKVPIAFPGRTVPNNMILFDGHIETDLNYNNITYVFRSAAYIPCYIWLKDTLTASGDKSRLFFACFKYILQGVAVIVTGFSGYQVAHHKNDPSLSTTENLANLFDNGNILSRESRWSPLLGFFVAEIAVMFLVSLPIFVIPSVPATKKSLKTQ
ncbi:hypothetical protein BG005_009254 [Podila minutissima]|nr:hypothetical protein BG005_009254 [Podila minutissima]